MEVEKANQTHGTTPTITQKGICDKHGEYMAPVIEFLGNPLWPSCPECERENQAYIAKQAVEEQELTRRNFEIKLEKSGIKRRFYSTTFDTFKADTPAKLHALERCRAFVAEKEANAKNGKSLFLLGKPGTGKNHLAVSIIREWGGDAIIKKAAGIIREVRSTYGTGGDEQGVLSRFAAYDLLVINEVGIQFGTEAEKNLLFEILDDRYESMLPTVFISNLNLAGVKEFVGGRVIDRMMQCGEVIEFLWESYREEVR